MYFVNVDILRGKITEKGFSNSSFAKKVGVSRNTLRSYLLHPEKISYAFMEKSATLLCDNHEDILSIFFAV